MTMPSTTPNKMAANTKPVSKVEQSLFEEDDEFEEFPTEEWGEDEEEKCDQLWEDNWDDDNTEDDFSIQLRAELERLGHKVSQ